MLYIFINLLEFFSALNCRTAAIHAPVSAVCKSFKLVSCDGETLRSITCEDGEVTSSSTSKVSIGSRNVVFMVPMLFMDNVRTEFMENLVNHIAYLFPQVTFFFRSGIEEAEEYEDPEEGLKAIVEYVRKADRKVVFLRLCVKAELDITRPTLSTIPYNQTVIMDTTGDDEEILSKLKKRGRRDVRKALRESPASYADETEQAYESFAEYYDVMIETAERDGFTPAPQSDYENMIHLLGKDHCRVFAGRVDGKVVTWTIATISGKHAVRYYGASRSDVPNRNFVTDGLIYFEACTLSKQGIETYDMMGIGNDFSPKLKTLNTFKTKFSNEVTDVAPDRDVPIRGTFYSALVTARKALKRG